MKNFQQYLEEELKELQHEIPIDFAERAAKGLESFFAQFASREHAALAVEYFENATNAGFTVDLGVPLQFLLTGTGEYGPEGESFIVASPQNNVLTWEQGGERHFASYVVNPGMEPRFTEDEMIDAMVSAIMTEDDE